MKFLHQLEKTGPPLTIALLFAFGLIAHAKAVVPPPDGGYPGFNTAEGQKAIFNLATGVGNTAVGWFSLFSDVDGSFNTAIGAGTLLFNVGNQNTGDGLQNTAIGTAALLFNTTGFKNTATGISALLNNTIGIENTANGAFALLSNSSGFGNTAMGALALNQNTAGSENNAFGLSALSEHTTGDSNNAVGAGALLVDQSGFANNAFGTDALGGNLTGNSNTAVGNHALLGCNGSANTALGADAGASAGTGSFNVYVGVGLEGMPGEVGHTYISNIKSTILNGAGTDTVTIDLNTGLLGHLGSSRRYKEDIHAMDNTSQAVYRLKPVCFRYKKEFDRTQSLAYGLIAEEVAEIYPGLVARDVIGRPESVHYEMVTAMLLNEFLKEHRKTAKLEATVALQQKQIEALIAGLQEVSAQLELTKSAPQVVNNP